MLERQVGAGAKKVGRIGKSGPGNVDKERMIWDMREESGPELSRKRLTGGREQRIVCYSVASKGSGGFTSTQHLAPSTQYPAPKHQHTVCRTKALYKCGSTVRAGGPTAHDRCIQSTTVQMQSWVRP